LIYFFFFFHFGQVGRTPQPIGRRKEEHKTTEKQKFRLRRAWPAALRSYIYLKIKIAPPAVLLEIRVLVGSWQAENVGIDSSRRDLSIGEVSGRNDTTAESYGHLKLTQNSNGKK